MGRAVGAEYHFRSRSWGGAPGWDGGGALPLKKGIKVLLLKKGVGVLLLKKDIGTYT